VKRNRLLLAGLGVAATAAVVWLFVNLTRTPQIGADEEAFKAVDALFTAVTARDETLLSQCEQRLRGLKEAGQLPGNAANALVGIITTARGGRWEAAARRLYGFMTEQRREGTPSQEGRKKPKVAQPNTSARQPAGGG
jgi:hypothetical protein